MIKGSEFTILHSAPCDNIYLLNYTVYIFGSKYIMIEQNNYIHFVEMCRKAYPDLRKARVL